jgi:hypothetical protein
MKHPCSNLRKIDEGIEKAADSQIVKINLRIPAAPKLLQGAVPLKN